MPRLALVALVCLLVSCGSGTEPNDGEPLEPADAVGLWNMAVSNIQGIDGTGRSTRCVVEWITTIPENLYITVPYNAAFRCGAGEGIWLDRGMGLVVFEKGDSLVFLTATRADTF